MFDVARSSALVHPTLPLTCMHEYGVHALGGILCNDRLQGSFDGESEMATMNSAAPGWEHKPPCCPCRPYDDHDSMRQLPAPSRLCPCLGVNNTSYRVLRRGPRRQNHGVLQGLCAK